MPSASEHQNRIHGALLAHAAGDALGATLEFLTAEHIATTIGVHRDIVGGGAFHWHPGQGTDDTDLTLIGCDSLIERGDLDLEDLARRLAHWYHDDPVDIGPTTRDGIVGYLTTGNPSTSGNPNSTSNGSLMRALAPGLAGYTDDTDRAMHADRLGAITHAHRDCRDACIAYADIVHHLINGATPADALAAARQRSLTPMVTVALDAGPQGLEPIATSSSGRVSYALNVAVAGLFDAEHHGLEDTLIKIANRGGDADTNAAIAGGLLGARHGAGDIPQRWVDQLEQRERIAQTANNLALLLTWKNC